MAEIFTVFGACSGATFGDIAIRSEIFRDTKTEIRLPRGCKAKVWTKRIAGNSVRIMTKVTKDITAVPPTFNPIDEEYLASDGVIELEKKKPMLIEARTGKEAVRFSWDGLEADNRATLTAEIEIEEGER